MSLLALFLSGFSSATLLPGSSEALFLYMLSERTEDAALLILIVGVGNSLGGMTNWLLGILIHKGIYQGKKNLSQNKRYSQLEKHLQKYGSPVLFFSFLPIIGDPLCVVAGLVNISWMKALVYISAGKFFRYMILSYFLI